MSDKSYTVTITQEDADKFDQAVQYLKEPYSENPMTPEELLENLIQDVIYTLVRPSCWEAANMQQVIDSHGWELHFNDEI